MKFIDPTVIVDPADRATLIDLHYHAMRDRLSEADWQGCINEASFIRGLIVLFIAACEQKLDEQRDRDRHRNA